jgi:F-type H+-transporting ATPase subunit alpha
MKEAITIKEVGEVVEVRPPLVKLKGLPHVKIWEIVKIGKEDFFVFKFDKEFVWALSLSSKTKVKPGMIAKRTNEILKIPVGEEFLGKIITPLGEDLELNEKIKTKEEREIEKYPPEIYQRELIREPLETGIKIIDALFPIGRGQRELILGDRKTGKTSISIDMILNQSDIVSIYTIIGQRKSELPNLIRPLYEFGKMDSTIIVAAFASDSEILQFLAPYCAMTLAEYFQEKKRDVLIIFDDLTKHAWAWRQISLQLGMPPGREAYPADIFYLHARLLERATNIKNKSSITAIPICETREGDITEYIPTNLISITDGQLYLENDLFQKGIKPAINIGLSVSRVGALAQRDCLKKLTKGLKLILVQHRELRKLIQLETELSEESRKILKRGNLLLEIFKQEKHSPTDVASQSILYWLILNGYLDDLSGEKIKIFEKHFLDFIEGVYPNLKEAILKEGFSKNIESILISAFQEFKDLTDLWQKSSSN